MSGNLIKSLQSATSTTLTNKRNKKVTEEIWKNYKTINSILETRKTLQRGSSAYKSINKKLKTRVHRLKNEKLTKEAQEIN